MLQLINSCCNLTQLFLFPMGPNYIKIILLILKKKNVSEISNDLYAWIGLDRQSGPWQWIDGTVASNVLWAQHEPDNKFCGASGWNDAIDDTYCSRSFPFTCQKNWIWIFILRCGNRPHQWLSRKRVVFRFIHALRDTYCPTMQISLILSYFQL